MRSAWLCSAVLAASCVFLAAASATSSSVVLAASAGSRPHILYALVDDLGHYNVQLTNPEVKTPHLVELREKGVWLDRHYTYKAGKSTDLSSCAYMFLATVLQSHQVVIVVRKASDSREGGQRLVRGELKH